MPATVRVKPPGGVWTTLGVDPPYGVVPQGLALTTNESGPDTCSFTLARDSRLPWGDLVPFTEVEVEAAGAGVVWSGRVWDTAYGDGTSVQVTCRGWQYSLDDVQLSRLWAHQQLAAWRDIREFDGANFSEFAGAGALNPQGGGILTWGLAGGQTLPTAANGGRAGWYLDGGETGAIARVVVTWESANNSTSVQTYLLESDTDPSSISTFTSIATWNAGASGTFTRTLGTPRRYVSVIANNNTAGDYTPLGQTWFRVTGVLAVRSTAYESGNASDLTATEALTDLLSNDLTFLSLDTSRIDTTTFDVPHLSYVGERVTARAVIQAVNAYHDYLAGVDHEKRLFFRQRPTTPALEVGEWSGATFSDAGDSGEELYNQVEVVGTGPDGQPLVVTRTATSTILDAASATRTRTLSVQAALTQAGGEAIGDAWLATRSARPTRGQVTVPGAQAVRSATSGAPVTPAALLLYVGERIRLSHRWDPDTGGWGRDAAITSVTWAADTDTAQVTLDSPRDRIDVVLSRLAAVRGAGQPLS